LNCRSIIVFFAKGSNVAKKTNLIDNNAGACKVVDQKWHYQPAFVRGMVD